MILLSPEGIHIARKVGSEMGKQLSEQVLKEIREGHTPPAFRWGRSIVEMLEGTQNERQERLFPEYETVNHPDHYNQHPSGVECIDVVEHMNFNLGNAMKYIWRHGDKPGVGALEDLRKAAWYLAREMERIEDAAFLDSRKGVE